MQVLCFSCSLLFLTRMINREVPKGRGGPDCIDGGFLAVFFTFQYIWGQICAWPPSSAWHAPSSLGCRRLLVLLPLAMAVLIFRNRRIVFTRQGVFTPWVARDGHASSILPYMVAPGGIWWTSAIGNLPKSACVLHTPSLVAVRVHRLQMVALIGFLVLFLFLTVCSVVKLTWSLVFAQNAWPTSCSKRFMLTQMHHFVGWVSLLATVYNSLCLFGLMLAVHLYGSCLCKRIWWFLIYLWFINESSTFF